MVTMGQPVPVDRVTAALDLMQTLRGSLDLLASLEKGQIGDMVKGLVEAKNASDKSLASATALSAESEKLSKSVAKREAALSSGEASLSERLKALDQKESEIGARVVSQDKDQKALDSRARQQDSREKSLQAIASELDSRALKLASAEQANVTLADELKRRLDAIKAAAGG